MGLGGRHGGRRIAGGRISLPRAGPGAFGREPATEESARAQPREASLWLWRLSRVLLAFAPPSFFAFLQIGRPAAGPRAAMSGLATQFGPGLLVASLATPLVVLALFLAPGLRALARAITPLAARARARRRRARDWRRAVRRRAACVAHQPLARSAGRPAARRSGARLAHRQPLRSQAKGRAGRTPTASRSRGCSRWPAVSACSSPPTF